MDSRVRTRIAPSPTGEDLHIGNLYTALLNFAFAKKHKGVFVVRIEDTDRERFVSGSEEKILATLKAFGLNYDEGPDIKGPFAPYRQSKRLSYYKEYAEELVEKGSAYYCFCTKARLDTMRKDQLAKKMSPRYDRHCLKNITNAKERVKNGEAYVIRLKVPDNKDVVFHDVIHGDIRVNSNQIDDQVLLKSDGYPTYHLGVVVDDHLMKITYVIRAEEWISSTPKHVLLYEAFGWEPPIFAHVPILRNPDRSKLSKRKNPVWASWYLRQGFLPEAMLNYLALMGWSHPEEKEIFNLNEFIKLFDLKDIHPVGPVFDIKKLEWLNGVYIRSMSAARLSLVVKEFMSNNKSDFSKEYSSFIEDGQKLEKLVALAQSRIVKLRDFFELTSWMVEKAVNSDDPRFPQVAKQLKSEFDNMSSWTKEEILSALKNTISSQKVKMSAIYLILTGKERGLPLPETLEILGKDDIIKRVRDTVE